MTKGRTVCAFSLSIYACFPACSIFPLLSYTYLYSSIGKTVRRLIWRFCHRVGMYFLLIFYEVVLRVEDLLAARIYDDRIGDQIVNERIISPADNENKLKQQDEREDYDTQNTYAAEIYHYKNKHGDHCFYRVFSEHRTDKERYGL